MTAATPPLYAGREPSPAAERLREAMGWERPPQSTPTQRLRPSTDLKRPAVQPPERPAQDRP